MLIIQSKGKDASLKELNFNIKALFDENCGLAAAIGIPNASRIAFYLLSFVEHRGEKASGFVSFDGRFHFKNKKGRVKQSFKDIDFEKELPGKVASAHARYPTYGDANSAMNYQPLISADSRWGPFAYSLNGTLVGADKIRKKMVNSGTIFRSTTDTEVFVQLMGRSGHKDIIKAIKYASKIIPAAYSMIIQTKDKLIAFTDRHGVRPLELAKYKGGYLVCSENYPFTMIKGCKYLGRLGPGKAAIFDKNHKIKIVEIARPDEHFCVFENIYFQFPGSFFMRKKKKITNIRFRIELGKQAYFEYYPYMGDVDYVVPILDSGKFSAMGFASAAGLSYKELILRVHNPMSDASRSFTASTQDERTSIVELKHYFDDVDIRGKNILIVDDSIVRSTTMRYLISRLMGLGARTIKIVIASPPIKNTCPYGMDFQSKGEIIAAYKNIEQIRIRIAGKWAKKR